MSKNALERLKEDESEYNKKKCKYLKEIRKAIADKLGVDLHQITCKYEGYCSGTCPKCKQEEEILNKVLNENVNVLNLKDGSALEIVELSKKLNISNNDESAINEPKLSDKEFVMTGNIIPTYDNKKDNKSNLEIQESTEEFRLSGNILL